MSSVRAGRPGSPWRRCDQRLFCVFEDVSPWKAELWRGISHLWIHFPNGYNGRNWAREVAFSGSPMRVQESKHAAILCCFPGCTGRELGENCPLWGAGAAGRGLTCNISVSAVSLSLLLAQEKWGRMRAERGCRTSQRYDFFLLFNLKNREKEGGVPSAGARPRDL